MALDVDLVRLRLRVLQLEFRPGVGKLARKVAGCFLVKGLF